MSANHRHRDRITVEIDGEELEVFNWVNVKKEEKAVVRAQGTEKFPGDPQIGAGDSSKPPEAVTEWVAEKLDWEFGIDVEKHGIDVIDVESEEVTVL